MVVVFREPHPSKNTHHSPRDWGKRQLTWYLSALGQNFSKMFDITVEDPEKKGDKIHVWQNSWYALWF